MASKLDQAFIDNLQNFTTALENIVELLQEQNKKGDDAINHMASTLDGDKIGKISEDIKKILEVSKSVDNRTKEILEEIKASRKQKESGLFGKVQDKENKEKIVSGVEVIMLIAGGVLAIGLAFQLVGNIDFLSVLALSAGILAVSYAFAEIGKMKDLTPQKALMIGLAFIVMSTAITISSIILQGFQSLNPMQMLSLVFVAGALGVAVLFISMAIRNMSFEPKDIAKYLLLPIILPAIAGGLVLSSFVLQNMQPVSWDKVLSLAIVGIGLGIASIGIMFVMKVLGDNINYKKILATTLILPIIAAGIVAASWAFLLFQPIKDPISLLIGSFIIGLSILMFTPTVFILSKIGIKQLLVGSLGIITVAGAIMISSWILNYGKYDGNYPSLKWSAGVGLAVLLFTPAVLALGIIAMTGIGALAIGAGALLVPVVAASIVAASHIFSTGDYGKYPSLKWALGTGLALAAFSIGTMALGIPGVGLLLNRGLPHVATIATAIKDASLTLAGGNFTGGPTKKWAEGIGLALGAFAQALDASTDTSFFSKEVDSEKFTKFMNSVANGMIEVAKVLGGYDGWDSGYPKKEWAEGVSMSIMPFVNAYEAMSAKQSLLGKVFGSSDDKFGDFMVNIAKSMVKVSKELANGTWAGGPDQTWAKNTASAISAFTESFSTLDENKVKIIDKFTDSIKDLVKQLDKLNTDGIDKLNNLTASITIMSAVDDAQLKKVLKVLDDNKKQLSNVISVEGSSGQAYQKQVSPQVVENIAALDQSQTISNDKILEKFDNVLSKFDELLIYVIQDKGGQNVNTTDTIQS